jgi:hypothetical protein
MHSDKPVLKHPLQFSDTVHSVSKQHAVEVTTRGVKVSSTNRNC